MYITHLKCVNVLLHLKQVSQKCVNVLWGKRLGPSQVEWKGNGQNISSATGANTLAPRTHTCKQQKVRTQCLFDAQCKTQTVVISQIQISSSWRLVDIFVALLLAQQILSFQLSRLSSETALYLPLSLQTYLPTRGFTF